KVTWSDILLSGRGSSVDICRKIVFAIMLSSRLTSILTRSLARRTPQIYHGSLGAVSVAVRNITSSSPHFASSGTAEVSSILEQRILGSAQKAELEETGRVLSIGDGIARVYGLKNIQAEEMVEFSSGLKENLCCFIHFYIVIRF
ncbi:hypothetical protein pdam_00014064, partial [Pocillopora damicornis]